LFEKRFWIWRTLRSVKEAIYSILATSTKGITPGSRQPHTTERVTAGMPAAEVRGKHLGRPSTPKRIVDEIVALAT
jgi:hypothetical protein